MSTKKMFVSALVGLVLSFTAALAQADEMDWSLKNRTKMECHLSDGMTLKHGNDFVETKKLVCWSGTELKVAASVSCGPEGSKTKFGKKLSVKCEQKRYARK